MANNENLKPVRSKSEARKRGKQGGINSGKARRKKKELKELLELALSQKDEVTGEDNYTAITMALIQRALLGETKAYEIIRDTLGQKPTDKFEMSTSDIKINIVGMEDDNA